MALKRLKVRLATPSPSEIGDEIPLIAIEGDLVKQYNDAADAMKQADALMEELRPDVEEIAKAEIFARGCKRPATPPTSVKLKDDSGEILMVSNVNKYKEVADVDAVNKLFELWNLDINAYVCEGVKAKFDDKVFYDEDGNFQQDIYDDIRKAIQTIVAKRQLPVNPLTTQKVIKPKPCFHVERFSIFPKVEAQQAVFAIMPNSLAVKPVRPAKGKAK